MSGPLVTGQRVRLTRDAEWMFSDLVGCIGIIETRGGNVVSVAWETRPLTSWLGIEDVEAVE